jgi:hypothetical protein
VTKPEWILGPHSRPPVGLRAEGTDDDSDLAALGKQFEEIAATVQKITKFGAPANWIAPISQIDWDARAVRLLIEAVRESAGVSLPFCDAADS